MQLTYLAAVLIATAFPAISSAALCTESEAAKPSDETYKLWDKVMIAMGTVMDEPQTSGSRLMKRVELNLDYPPVDCMLLPPSLSVIHDVGVLIATGDSLQALRMKNAWPSMQ